MKKNNLYLQGFLGTLGSVITILWHTFSFEKALISKSVTINKDVQNSKDSPCLCPCFCPQAVSASYNIPPPPVFVPYQIPPPVSFITPPPVPTVLAPYHIPPLVSFITPPPFPQALDSQDEVKRFAI